MPLCGCSAFVNLLACVSQYAEVLGGFGILKRAEVKAFIIFFVPPSHLGGGS